ncbi:hypothetical protein DBV15_01711 [Temnothorax longispinosus]|uniref:Uncharacterized protein n=1 Tax=Temnothorax longispinosus TaxID=300112 RepID=A0A4S2L6W4_9HYME|nr:hypothetical protein DBV15_01711 [Temnothorax longispinosus]
MRPDIQAEIASFIWVRLEQVAASRGKWHHRHGNGLSACICAQYSGAYLGVILLPPPSYCLPYDDNSPNAERTDDKRCHLNKGPRGIRAPDTQFPRGMHKLQLYSTM